MELLRLRRESKSVQRAVNIPGNYLSLMRKRLRFGGKYNMRKLVVLYVLVLHKRLSTKELCYLAGGGCTYASMRATVSRLKKYRYISAVPDHKYSVLAKGLRFLYACKTLYPEYHQRVVDWVKGV